MENQNKPYLMKYTLGTNFDFQLLEEIEKYDREKSIVTIFGKLRKDFMGGGRASMVLPDISWKDLGRYIAECHKRNLRFNYLLNPMCMGNKEFEKRYNKKIVKYLDKLANIGVDEVTINSNYLCELIKAQFPNFKVTVGLYARVNSLQQVRCWIDLGADEITLKSDLIRNFPALETMLIHTRKSGVVLRLIANNVCLHECPYSILHGTGQAHGSEKGHFSSGFFLDYCLLKCNTARFNNPVKFLSSDWIRPEDVKYYEQLCRKTGNPNLSIKLLERTKSTEFLVRIIKAYTSRSYEGNLADLLSMPASKGTFKIHRLPLYLKLFKGQYNLKEMLKYEGLFNLPDIYIDNKRLDGFLDKFVTHYDCTNKMCDDEGFDDSPGKDSQKQDYICNYCRKWANKTIKIDKEEVRKWTEKCKDFLDNLARSETFKFIK